MTSHILPAERAKASFDVAVLHEMLNGGAETVATRKKFEPLFDKPIYDRSNDYLLDRQTYYRKHVERALESFKIMKANPDLLGAHSPIHGGGDFPMTTLTNNGSAIGSDHFGLFLATLFTQCTPEQIREWVPRAMNLQIIGCYAQTELGHGTNVRGLETTATFDPKTDEFVIHSPTITARKWWPGGLGVLTTHAIVYARLILGNTDHGYHAFLVQLRDQNHKPRPGVTIGDIGPKLGFNYVDSGFASFDHLRIPRFNMLAKYQHVTADGKYVRPPRAASKIGYLTMTRTRIMISYGAGFALAKAVTIAIRYNAIRKQGFRDGADGEEETILNFPQQQMRLFPQLATAYAMILGARGLIATSKAFEKSFREGKEETADTLAELHATSAGFKAICTDIAALGIEEVRQCCGGQGYAMSGGIAPLLASYLPNITFEGDKIPMLLQTGRFLVRFATKQDKAPLPAAVSYIAQEVPRCQWRTLADARNPKLLQEAYWFSARSAVLLAARDVQKSMASGLSFEKSLVMQQVSVVRAAVNHCMATIVARFAEEAAQASNAGVRAVLGRLFVVFALHRILTGATLDWQGYLGESHLELARQALADTMQELRPDVVPLVDAFGFSDNALGSCIGRYDGNVYEALVEFAAKSQLNEPSFQESVWRDLLKPLLDQKYLAKL